MFLINAVYTYLVFILILPFMVLLQTRKSNEAGILAFFVLFRWNIFCIDLVFCLFACFASLLTFHLSNVLLLSFILLIHHLYLSTCEKIVMQRKVYYFIIFKL